MDCFQETCLYCERFCESRSQGHNAPYCSAQCRDHDQYRTGFVTLQLGRDSAEHCRSGSGSDTNSYNSISFNSSSSTLDSRSIHPSHERDGSNNYTAFDGHDLHRSRASRSLSTCSSQSSFSLTLAANSHQQASQAVPPQPIISEVARKELSQYVGLFDQTREQRRPSYPGLKYRDDGWEY